MSDGYTVQLQLAAARIGGKEHVVSPLKFNLDKEIRTMSADKHKGLATRAAYLRLAQGTGLGLNVKWAAKLTPFLQRMIADGEITLRRIGSDGRGGKAVTTAYTTPAGDTRLLALEARFGPDFGSRADIVRIEPPREDKKMRRQRTREPEAKHLVRAKREARMETSRRSVAILTNRLIAQKGLQEATKAA